MERGAERRGAAADRVVEWASRLRKPAVGTRVLAIEGRSGSGKTGLALAVAERLGAPVIHMDDLYPGWDGLEAGVTMLGDRVLAPLAAGRPAVWQRWDWTAGAYAEEHRVPDADWVVVEGVGAGGRALWSYHWGVVWLECPTAERKRRALARDGEVFAPHWERWARQEEAFYAAERVRERAGLELPA
jgi:hypothetical protein